MEALTAAASVKVVYLSSPEGQRLLENVIKARGGLYQPILHAIFMKQVTRAGCGMQSCALLLSANSLGQRFEPQSFLNIKPSSIDSRIILYTERGMYSLPQTLGVTNSTAVAMHGLTLCEVAQIMKSHGCTVKEVHAMHASPTQFRNDIIDALSHSDSRSGVIVNFSRKKLSPTSRRSHHSPLVAYHTATDRVLILDTGVDMPDFWVPVNDLFEAMNTEDHVSKQSRGYCIATK